MDSVSKSIYDTLKNDKYAYQSWLDAVVRNKHSTFYEEFVYELESRLEDIDAPEVRYTYDEAGEYCNIVLIDEYPIKQYIDKFGKDELYIDITNCIKETLQYYKTYLFEYWQNTAAKEAIGDWITPIFENTVLRGYKNEITGRKTLF